MATKRFTALRARAIAWTKGAALKYARAWEDDHRKHPHLDPDGSEVRVSNLIEGVANRPGKSGKGVAPATREKEAKVFSRIDQAFGDWPVTAVSTEMVIDWVESLVRDFSPGMPGTTSASSSASSGAPSSRASSPHRRW